VVFLDVIGSATPYATCYKPARQHCLIEPPQPPATP